MAYQRVLLIELRDEIRRIGHLASVTNRMPTTLDRSAKGFPIGSFPQQVMGFKPSLSVRGAVRSEEYRSAASSRT